MNTYNLLFNALFIAIFMQFIAWIWQIKTKNADIVDITWAAGIVVCTLYYYFAMSNIQTVSYLMLIFPGLWYLRLLIHLIVRYRVSHEDNRYAYLRKHWESRTQTKFFGFFMFQAVLIWFFAMPAYWLRLESNELSLNVIVALAVGLISFIGVTIADKQLLNFKKNNSKKVCDIGLWKYSRHPNYFFEWLHWFVYPILLISSPYLCWALMYPFVMLYFLLELTGIPFSEQQSLINRGDSYREYQSRTNKFFPWKPKSD
jgi:cyclopropane-fatty-acyl-phospholipid synthase